MVAHSLRTTFGHVMTLLTFRYVDRWLLMRKIPNEDLESLLGIGPPFQMISEVKYFQDTYHARVSYMAAGYLLHAKGTLVSSMLLEACFQLSAISIALKTMLIKPMIVSNKTSQAAVGIEKTLQDFEVNSQLIYINNSMAFVRSGVGHKGLSVMSCESLYMLPHIEKPKWH